jgi:hypothetical protein
MCGEKNFFPRILREGEEGAMRWIRYSGLRLSGECGGEMRFGEGIAETARFNF